ncbi:MAG: sigma-70 family RNA polymerase sigma factor SigK [Candidatus Acidiferrum sp.]
MIARMAQGDQSALADFYDHTGALIYGLIQRMLNNPAVAEEVTLDVYAQVWKQAGQYNAARGKPLTWLIMMGRSRAIDSLRSRKNEALEQQLNFRAEYVDGAPSAEDTVAAGGRQSIVRSALHALAPMYREMIELAFFAGLSHSEISKKLGQPLGTVKSRIRAGMMQMRESLQVYGDAL